MRKPHIHGRAVSGFTLVEMAIVLVIIGIILAGVMKGRDIVRGAQVKAFSQQFAQKWGTIAQTYYDKTGQFLNDGSDNGGSGTLDGLMDGAMPTSGENILNVLENVGITPCTLIKSKLTSAVTDTLVASGTTVCQANSADLVNPWQTLVEGEYTGSVVVSVDLQALLIDMNDKQQKKNCVILYNVPVDVAKGLDTAIDGQANGLTGACIGGSDAYDPAGSTSYSLLKAATASSTDTTTATAWDDTADSSSAYAQTVVIILDY